LMMHLEKNDKMIQAMRVLKEEMIGSFCFTMLTDDGSVYAVRDTRGFRPLVLGYIEETNTYMISSESCAIDTVDGKLLGDIQPGELLKISSKGIERQQFSTSEYHSHCAFEFTYFAHPSSTIEGVNVYEARKKMGHHLARKYPVKDADVVIPVPDSARPAALGYAEELGIHFEEGLLKDRYRKKGSMRSFIEPYHGERIEINKGIVPIPEVIRGKNVVVIDDSIVRGTSSQSIIKILRSVGASKISLILTFPPIKYPCYAGIDFPSQDELLAFQNQNNENDDLESEIAKSLGADKVIYNDTVTLSQAIGIDERELCFSCSNGNYKPLGIKPVFKTRAEVKGDLEN